MYPIGARQNLFHGTIAAGGTLSSEIEISDYSALTLMSDANLALGTLSFQVAPYSDNDIPADLAGLGVDTTPLYRDLLGSNGAALAIGPVSGAIAIQSSVISQYLGGHRFVKIKMTPAQASGVHFFLTG